MDLSFGIAGLDFLKDINLSGVFTTVTNVITFIVLALIAAGIVAFIFFRKKEGKLYFIKIHYFEDVNGRPIPIKDYDATELTIPNTSIQVFYIKEVDAYFPRGKRAMGKNSYWYMKLANGEIVNFDLPSMNKELTQANLYYDHTDTRYAHENLKQIIKREYRDKSVKWWKEYKEVISLVIIVFVMTLSFIFIISRIGGLIDKMAPLIEMQKGITEELKEITKYIAESRANSGIIIKS